MSDLPPPPPSAPSPPPPKPAFVGSPVWMADFHWAQLGWALPLRIAWWVLLWFIAIPCWAATKDNTPLRVGVWGSIVLLGFLVGLSSAGGPSDAEIEAAYELLEEQTESESTSDTESTLDEGSDDADGGSDSDASVTTTEALPTTTEAPATTTTEAPQPCVARLWDATAADVAYIVFAKEADAVESTSQGVPLTAYVLELGDDRGSLVSVWGFGILYHTGDVPEENSGMWSWVRVADEENDKYSPFPFVASGAEDKAGLTSDEMYDLMTAEVAACQ